jgi:antitoxin component YwqK of YwqJK toxin-antitoxin module
MSLRRGGTILIQKRKISFLIALLFLLTQLVYSQQQADTIYFDHDWSICEKPVAKYYRIAALKTINMISYNGPVADYYIDGNKEMTGHYAEDGSKQGVFVFFDHDGKITKQGNFESDIMKGLWRFYDSSGELRVQVDCNSSFDFTPILIIAKAGDTVLTNGTGKFKLSFGDFERIRPKSYSYSIEGTVDNGKKKGRLDYHFIYSTDRIAVIDYNDKDVIGTEVFKDGRFIKVYERGYRKNDPLQLIDLSDQKLERVDNFYHSNLVFGIGEENDNKLIDFLTTKATPYIDAHAASYDDNLKAVFKLIGEVIREDKQQFYKNYHDDFKPRGSLFTLMSFNVPMDWPNSIPNFNSEITIDINPQGYIDTTAFNGNLEKDKIEKINYYLSRLTILHAPSQDSTSKENILQLHVFTIVDTLKDDHEISIGYYCTDDNNPDSLQDLLTIRSYVEKNLKFPEEAMKRSSRRTIVRVEFTIDDNYRTTDIKLDKDPGFGMGDEAIRLIKNMPPVMAKKYLKSGSRHYSQTITFQTGSMNE